MSLLSFLLRPLQRRQVRPVAAHRRISEQAKLIKQQKVRIADQAERISAQRRRAPILRRRGFSDGVLTALGAFLTPSQVVIDCGANVGLVTDLLAGSGATVHAFEPDPHALDILRRKFADRPNVIIHPFAIGISVGTATFYRSETHDADPQKSNEGNSLFKDHTPDRSGKRATVEVQVIDFPAFVDDLLAKGADLRFIKIDVEGAELDVLRTMLDRGLFDRIPLTVAETHETQLPALATQFAALRADIAARYPKTRVNLDWI